MKKALLVVAVLLACFGSAKADPAPVAGMVAGPALWAGASLYKTVSSGLTPEQSALAGVSYSGYMGSWLAGQFTPTYTLGVLAGLDTLGVSNFPTVGIQGGWYLDGVPMTAFLARRLDTGAQGCLVGIGTSVQFTGYVPFLYLGKPGN